MYQWDRCLILPVIRTYAACRIQALLRGARTRISLSRENHAGLRMILRRKLGRRKPINIQLQIPHDIGGSSHSANSANGPKDKPYSSKHIRPIDTTNLNGISRGKKHQNDYVSELFTKAFDNVVLNSAPSYSVYKQREVLKEIPSKALRDHFSKIGISPILLRQKS